MHSARGAASVDAARQQTVFDRIFEPCLHMVDTGQARIVMSFSQHLHIIHVFAFVIDNFKHTLGLLITGKPQQDSHCACLDVGQWVLECGVADACRHLFHRQRDAFHHRIEQISFVFEMPIDCTSCNACRFGNFRERST